MATADLLSKQRFTPLPNTLLDAMISADLTKRQYKVLLHIARQTFGFNKTEDDMTITQIARRTGLAQPHASKALKELAARQIVRRARGRYGYRVGINAAYPAWDDDANGQAPVDARSVDKIGAKQVGERTEQDMADDDNSHRDRSKRSTQKTIPKHKSKTKAVGLPDGLPGCIPEQAWADFAAHRAQIKKPLTELAAKRAVARLLALHQQGQDVARVIDQSIECGWTGLFPVKGRRDGQAGAVGVALWGDTI